MGLKLQPSEEGERDGKKVPGEESATVRLLGNRTRSFLEEGVPGHLGKLYKGEPKPRI